MDLIYNRELGITEEDVYNETNMQTLINWRHSIEDQITNIYMVSDSNDWQLLPHHKRVAVQFQRSLLKKVNHRINDIRFEQKLISGFTTEKSKRKDRTIAMYFMQTVQHELEQEEFERIKKIAKEKLAEDTASAQQKRGNANNTNTFSVPNLTE